MSKYQGKTLLLTAIALVSFAFAAGCGPVVTGLSPEQVQIMIATGVAGTVQAQNNMGTAVAQTVTALAPTSTVSPTPVQLSIPSFTPLASVTPFATPQASSGGAGGKPDWACDVSTRPFDGTAYKPGDPFDIKWTITNTGGKTWAAGKDLEYFSGPMLTTRAGVQLPQIQPGDTYTLTADANAPMEKGYYVMTWKLEGGFCWPYVAIRSGRPGIDP